MNQESHAFRRSLFALMGVVIGVGIFGLPYVFAQAGVAIGLAHLAVIAAVNTTLLLVFAQLVVRTKGSPRLSGIVRRYLGAPAGWFAALVGFGSAWGAMIAYIIIGGEFLHALFSPMIGGALTTYQLGFFVVASLMMIGGLGFVGRVETILMSLLFVILAIVLMGSIPHIEPANLMTIDASKWFLPFGVVYFALGGFAAIPEMSAMLGRWRSRLPQAILMASAIIVFVYVIFGSMVVAVTGTETSHEAILGVAQVVGPWALVLGATIGVLAVFTSFILLGMSIVQSLVHDFKVRYMRAWILAISVPLFAYLAGARDFIDVIGLTGALMGGLVGGLIILTYLRARRDPSIPKRALTFPIWILGICFLILMVGMFLTILG